MQLAQSFEIALPIAVFAFVYSFILVEGGEVLSPIFRFLESRLPEWLFKPIIGCEKCVAGQIALWSYAFRAEGRYDAWYHIFTIALAILLTELIKYIYSWIKNQAGY